MRCLLLLVLVLVLLLDVLGLGWRMGGSRRFSAEAAACRTKRFEDEDEDEDDRMRESYSKCHTTQVPVLEALSPFLGECRHGEDGWCVPDS